MKTQTIKYRLDLQDTWIEVRVTDELPGVAETTFEHWFEDVDGNRRIIKSHVNTYWLDDGHRRVEQDGPDHTVVYTADPYGKAHDHYQNLVAMASYKPHCR